MGLKLYGIGCAENVDNSGETLRIAGLDDSRLNLIRDEHDGDNFFHKIGAVTFHKKIFSEKDCDNPKQLRCWKHAQVPFLYAEAEMANDTDHPNAKSAAELIKFTSRPDISPILSIGWSIDGGITERQDSNGRPTEDGKILTKTVATAIALTHKPCNPKCRVFMENDLTKSDMTMPPPSRYFKALKSPQSSHSINHLPHFDLYIKMEQLKKSLTDYFGGFTNMQCKNCGKGLRFFKSSKDLPNGCNHCGKHFTMSDIWSALNKSDKKGK